MGQIGQSATQLAVLPGGAAVAHCRGRIQVQLLQSTACADIDPSGSGLTLTQCWTARGRTKHEGVQCGRCIQEVRSRAPGQTTAMVQRSQRATPCAPSLMRTQTCSSERSSRQLLHWWVEVRQQQQRRRRQWPVQATTAAPASSTRACTCRVLDAACCTCVLQWHSFPFVSVHSAHMHGGWIPRLRSLTELEVRLHAAHTDFLAHMPQLQQLTLDQC